MTKKKNKYYEGFRTLIAGISGMGKSFYTKKTFIPLLAKFKPVIIFDRKGEYAGKHAVDHDPAWGSYHGTVDFFTVLGNGNGMLKNGVHIINCTSDKDYISGFIFFLRLKEPVSLVLDEAHDIFLDKDFYQAKIALVKMVRYGRSYGVDVILISQRTKDIPPDIRSQFLGAISFKQSHQDDVKALDERGWLEADKVLNLGKTQYLVFGEFPDHIQKSLAQKT